MTDQTDREPEVISRYLKAADDGDVETLVACFTPDATVLDEGNTYTGHDEIRRWRSEGPAQFDYTTTVTSSEPEADGGYTVGTRVVGNFPGGTADLRYHFELLDGAIADLKILE
jgi:ketosteroid isomerase-like protein